MVDNPQHHQVVRGAVEVKEMGWQEQKVDRPQSMGETDRIMVLEEEEVEHVTQKQVSRDQEHPELCIYISPSPV